MAEEKKGFFARLFGQQQKSDCCCVRIEEIPEEDQEKAPPQARPEHRSSCCGPAPKTETDRGSVS